MTLVLTYSARSRPSAQLIAEASEGRIILNRGNEGDVNWGRCEANTGLNPDISMATNKRLMRERFADYDIPMPRLYTPYEALEYITNDEPKFFDSAAHEGTVLIGRPDRHTKGRGLWRLYDGDNASYDRAMRGTRRKRPATHFMEYIEATHEYRVHVFQRRSIRISEKDFDAPADSRYYSTIRPTGDISLVRTAAWKAVDALGLDFGAVDVLALDDGTPYCLEVNTAPGLGGSTPKLWADTFLRWYNERDY